MEKSMKYNFQMLEKRILDALTSTDLEKLFYQFGQIEGATLVSGVGGSSVVASYVAKVLNEKNGLVAVPCEPRDFRYQNLQGFKNVIACSYSGNNYGVQLALSNSLNHYLLSNQKMEDDSVVSLTYKTTLEKERSFISLAATLIPITMLLQYYRNTHEWNPIKEKNDFSFDVHCDAFEIFSGWDTSTAAKFLESTFVESAIGIPIVHDKYSFCHGRHTFGYHYQNIAIYFNTHTEFDKMILEELRPYYKEIVVLESDCTNVVERDYDFLVQAMYLSKYIAKSQEVDLADLDHSPLAKKLYNYHGEI